MDVSTVHKILAAQDVPPANSVKQIEVGFTNTVYSVDDRYILKVCTDTKGNESPFRLEVELYEYFNATLPVPRLIAYDDSKTLIPYHYMLYPKIEGDNLYNVWHTLSREERRDIIRQLCGMLRIINSADIARLPTDVLQPVSSWRDAVMGRLQQYLRVARDMRTLDPEVLARVATFVDKNAHCLDEQKLALVYWDVHFDNVLVKGNNIVGLLDFERTEIASIDFVLDTVKRMVDYPKKYMSAYAEQFARDEDYKDLLDWYREFYPELFGFTDLSCRLDLYTLAHNLEDLENWPETQELKDVIGLITSGK